MRALARTEDKGKEFFGDKLAKGLQVFAPSSLTCVLSFVLSGLEVLHNRLRHAEEPSRRSPSSQTKM